MQMSHLGSIEINEAPPPLDLTPQQIALPYDRKGQAHGGASTRQGWCGLLSGNRSSWQELLFLSSVSPQKPLLPEEAFERVLSMQRRNHAAYRSHRKRTLERLDGL